MKADPAAFPLLNIFFKGSYGCGSPRIRRVIELNEELILRQKGIIDLLRVFDVINREAIDSRFLLQPDFRRVDKGFVDAALFSDGDDSELRQPILGGQNSGASKCNAYDNQKPLEDQSPQVWLTRHRQIFAPDALSRFDNHFAVLSRADT